VTPEHPTGIEKSPLITGLFLYRWQGICSARKLTSCRLLFTMLVFLLISVGVPALYVGLIRGFAYVFAPNDELDSLAALRLRWLHWLVTGSAFLCLVLITGKLGLHYPLCTMAWLLGSGVLAGRRRRLHQLLPEERSWAKAQVWLLGVLSPFLVGAALISSDDVAFEDANARVEVDHSFAMEASEEYGRIRFYQTRCFLFHEQVGRLHDSQMGVPSAGTIYGRDWWKRVQAVAFGPTDREVEVFFMDASERSITIRME
jgi:hypothetical protein